MKDTLWLLFAVGGAIVIIAIGILAAIAKSAKSEEEMIRRLDAAMMKGVRDDPNELARFIP